MSDIFDDLPAFRAKLGQSKDSKATQNFKGSGGRLQRAGPGARGRNVRPATANSQRVIVKASVTKLGNGAKGREKATAHLKYLLRDGAQKEGESAILFDKNTEQTSPEVSKKPPEAADFIAKCEDDKHMFRIILSPENGAKLDLKSYTQSVMERMERDVKAELDWVAVVHKNTDNPHVHIVLRGKINGDQDLYLKPEYIANGIRLRAQEVATFELGERTKEDVTRAYEREVKQHRFTSLDKNILKSADENLKVQPDRLFGRDEDKNALIQQRLEYLSALKLIEKSGRKWTLIPNFSQSLKDLGRRHDIIHRMHNAGKNQSGDWRFEQPDKEILARVAHRGLTDDQAGTQFIIADGADGRTYYLDHDQKFANETKPGAIVQIGKGTASVLSSDRLSELIKYHGPTVLDHPKTYETIENSEAKRGQFIHELRAQVAERQRFLRHELGVTFEKERPSYVELRQKEVSKACSEIAKSHNATPLNVTVESSHEGRFLKEIKLNSGSYCPFKTSDKKQIALIQSDKYVQKALKAGKPVRISLTEKDGRKRLYISELTQNKTKGRTS